MLTDEDLSDLLRSSFADATGSLTSSPDLTRVVRRRHSAAQRRRAAVRVGVPALALASVGMALAAPSRHAISHTAAPSTPMSTSTTGVRQVSYRVQFPKSAAGVDCPVAVIAVVGGATKVAAPAITYVREPDHCASGYYAVSEADQTVPHTATPLNLGTFLGLYGWTQGGNRTVWAPNGHGTYWAVTVGAKTPDSVVAQFFTPQS